MDNRVCIVMFGDNGELYTNAGHDDNKLILKLRMIGKYEYVRELEWSDLYSILKVYDTVIVRYADSELSKYVYSAEVAIKYAKDLHYKLSFSLTSSQMRFSPVHQKIWSIGLDKPTDQEYRDLMYDFHMKNGLTSLTWEAYDKLRSLIVGSLCKLIENSLNDRMNSVSNIDKSIESNLGAITSYARTFRENQEITERIVIGNQYRDYTSINEYKMHILFIKDPLDFANKLYQAYVESDRKILLNHIFLRTDLMISGYANRIPYEIGILTHESCNMQLFKRLLQYKEKVEHKEVKFTW